MSGTYRAIRLGPDKNPSLGTVIAEGTREQVQPLWVAGEVAICWSPVHKPMRRVSEAGLASIRTKRLRRKLDRKLPLLADLIEEAERLGNPDYYAGKSTPVEATGR